MREAFGNFRRDIIAITKTSERTHARTHTHTHKGPYDDISKATRVVAKAKTTVVAAVLVIATLATTIGAKTRA